MYSLSAKNNEIHYFVLLIVPQSLSIPQYLVNNMAFGKIIMLIIFDLSLSLYQTNAHENYITEMAKRI